MTVTGLPQVDKWTRDHLSPESLAYITDLFVDTETIIDENSVVKAMSIEGRHLKDAELANLNQLPSFQELSQIVFFSISCSVDESSGQI